MKYSTIRILMLGNALEYYDFFLCSFFVSIIAPSFFPVSDPLANLLLGFGFMGAGFIARPLGALFFGYWGDKYGRKYALMKTLLLMGVSTSLIGLLPTYEKIGFYASLFLIILRLLQGFAIGGEVNGSAIFGLELSPQMKRGFIGALLSSSAGLGAILATFFGLLFINDFMPDWTWRLLFCLGAGAAFIGICMRRAIPEITPPKSTRIPLVEVIQKYPFPFLKTIGIGVFLHCTFYITVGCINPILHAKGFLNRTELILMDGGLVLFGTILSPFIGSFSDRIGYRRLMLFGACGQMLLAFPFFLSNAKGGMLEIFSMSLLLMLFSQFFNAPSNAYLNTLFPPECRYTGISFGICLGVALSGGLMPLICSQLLQISLWAPAFFLMANALIGIISLKKPSPPSLPINP